MPVGLKTAPYFSGKGFRSAAENALQLGARGCGGKVELDFGKASLLDATTPSSLGPMASGEVGVAFLSLSFLAEAVAAV